MGGTRYQYAAAQAAIFVVVVALTALPLASSNTGPSSAVSGVSPDGLRLRIALNSTMMRQGGSISGEVAVENTLGRNITISVPGPSQNMSTWGYSISVCPTGSFVGYAVFEGRLGPGNISSAGTPLREGAPVPMNCPAPYYVPGPVTFLPAGEPSSESAVYAQRPSAFVRSSVDATTTFCNTVQSGPRVYSCTWASPGLVGYWSDNASAGGDYGFTSPAFVPFPPGVYTVMAWDVWNQYAYATFVVES